MIFDSTEMNIRFHKSMVKTYRKSIWSFAGGIFLNIILVGINIPLDLLINKIAIGALAMNAAWQLFFLWDSIDDYKYHKEMLHLHQKHNTYEERQQSIDSYNSAKIFYENMAKDK